MDEKIGNSSNVKGLEIFEAEMKNLLSINFLVKEVNGDTSLDVMDSLAITEVVTLAEEHMLAELTYAQVKGCKTYGELLALLC